MKNLNFYLVITTVFLLTSCNTEYKDISSLKKAVKLNTKQESEAKQNYPKPPELNMSYRNPDDRYQMLNLGDTFYINFDADNKSATFDYSSFGLTNKDKSRFYAYYYHEQGGIENKLLRVMINDNNENFISDTGFAKWSIYEYIKNNSTVNERRYIDNNLLKQTFKYEDMEIPTNLNKVIAKTKQIAIPFTYYPATPEVKCFLYYFKGSFNGTGNGYVELVGIKEFFNNGKEKLIGDTNFDGVYKPTGYAKPAIN